MPSVPQRRGLLRRRLQVLMRMPGMEVGYLFVFVPPFPRSASGRSVRCLRAAVGLALARVVLAASEWPVAPCCSAWQVFLLRLLGRE